MKQHTVVFMQSLCSCCMNQSVSVASTVGFIFTERFLRNVLSVRKLISDLRQGVSAVSAASSFRDLAGRRFYSAVYCPFLLTVYFIICAGVSASVIKQQRTHFFFSHAFKYLKSTFLCSLHHEFSVFRFL